MMMRPILTNRTHYLLFFFRDRKQNVSTCLRIFLFIGQATVAKVSHLSFFKITQGSN